jgi:SpoIID/LytB domain protein
MLEHKLLFKHQLDSWSLAAKNYADLKNIFTKELILDGLRFRVQCNPARLLSSSANISKEALQKRPCFLCKKNRPKEQEGFDFNDSGFTVLVNPFPVFPHHYTVTAGHQPQLLQGHFGTMLDLAREMNDCVIFYNGPRCGASAPDHLHFQAGSKGLMPIESDYKSWRETHVSEIQTTEAVRVFSLKGMLRGGWLLESADKEGLIRISNHLLELLKIVHPSKEEEPMLNLLSWFDEEQWKCVVFPRKAHRPSCYFQEGDAKMLISPASVEMGGLIVTARSEDFERVCETDLRTIFQEVSLCEDEVQEVTNAFLKTQEPLLEVGIVSGKEIPFTFPVAYRMNGSSESYIGTFSAQWQDGKILFNETLFDQIEWEPIVSANASFELPKVLIGIGFHWERTEKQSFEGHLKLIVEGDKLTVVNRIPLESYLISVISSEMSAKASAELLKAHAIISRSWLLSQIRQKGKTAGKISEFIDNETERIRWYDREDHLHFDVCADDHCQRYQGVTKASTPQVREAIRATRGLVLMSGNEICDARFSKSCGGAMEEFQYCWENSPKAYLKGLADIKEPSECRCGNQRPSLPDLRLESNAIQWIMGKPDAFCNTQDKRILEQVLNHYDQETTDFFRWKVSYTTEEISRLIGERSGIDFGEIQDLIPIERGVSGRLVRLKIVGSKKTIILGKELEIRRTLSTSHLYSSAFVVEKKDDGFILHGAGWGHGVGLCQIGAAVMGEQGYSYPDILNHYYPNTILEKIYR